MNFRKQYYEATLQIMFFMSVKTSNIIIIGGTLKAFEVKSYVKNRFSSH